MKLYHQPRTRSARVRWLLGELDLTGRATVHPIDVFKGEGRAPEYMEIHPHGFVPALEDDGVVFIESAAICMYLADRYGDGKFAPAIDTAQRGKYYEWMVYIPATADPCLETIMFHTVFLPEEKRLPQLAVRSKERWTKKIEPRIASTLADRSWILGQEFSAADVMVGSTLAWAQMAGVLGAAPALASYMDRISKRPAFVETYAR